MKIKFAMTEFHKRYLYLFLYYFLKASNRNKNNTDINLVTCPKVDFQLFQL